MPAKFKNAAGKGVPGVTTILKQFQDPNALKFWANKIGLQGIRVSDYVDEAARIGRLAHQMVDCYIKGAPLPELDPETDEPARLAFTAFLDWQAENDVDIQETEVGLVSETYQYSGIVDGIGLFRGKPAIFDWKTGGIYDDHLCQIAAYGFLVRERETRDDPYSGYTFHGGYHLCRFDKETGEFTALVFSRAEMVKPFDQFLRFRTAYKRRQDLKKVLKRKLKEAAKPPPLPVREIK